jgi:hypothetical protein
MKINKEKVFIVNFILILIYCLNNKYVTQK